jgi:hypothetical protein
MIELTQAQAEALDGAEEPPLVVDPLTNQEYLLIRREVYDKVRLMLKPFARDWDDPADDLIRKDI